MSVTAKENPRYYSGPQLELDTHLAVDSKTWTAGEWCYLTGSGKVAPLTGTAQLVVYGIFGDSQPTNTSSSAGNVKVWKIVSPETHFVGYVSTGATDEASTLAMVGVAGTRVGTNSSSYTVLTLDTNNDTASHCLFLITQTLWNQVPFDPNNKSSTSPGQVIFKIADPAFIQG